jgi:membrane fusion protein (multidrug efflux system)
MDKQDDRATHDQPHVIPLDPSDICAGEMDEATVAAAPEPRPAPAAASPAPRARSRRARLFTILGAVIAVAAIGWVIWWFAIGQNHVTTDNAYVDADVAQITPQVSGPVVGVNVVDTQAVRKGQVLVTIDPTDFQIALAQAKAQLGQAQRRVQGYFANDEALAGQVAARDADIARANAQVASAQSDLDRAQTELGRRQRLASSGAVSGDELTQAQNQYSTAKAALESARAGQVLAKANRGAAEGSKSVNSALISGVSVAGNPEVAAAQANVQAAELNLQRTVLTAPFDGVIAKKDVQIGQRAQPGQALMSVVPVAHAYVNANFKEVQLGKVRLGQPVILTADLCGSGVKLHGVVAGLAGGTGAAFSLIPAQNATGNWIKVVQRLPVRVEIDPEDMSKCPLRVGLSMKADVDVSKH